MIINRLLKNDHQFRSEESPRVLAHHSKGAPWPFRWGACWSKSLRASRHNRTSEFWICWRDVNEQYMAIWTRKQSAQSLDCSYNWRLENIIIFAAALDCSTWGLDTPHTVFSDYDAAEIQSTIQVTSEVSCRVLTWAKSSLAQSWPCDGRWHDEKLHRLRPHLEDLASRHRNISWLHPSQSQYWIVFICKMTKINHGFFYHKG